MRRLDALQVNRVPFVMAGLDPAINVFFVEARKVDARVKPAHDEWSKSAPRSPA
jgi:hypothetical protein